MLIYRLVAYYRLPIIIIGLGIILQWMEDRLNTDSDLSCPIQVVYIGVVGPSSSNTSAGEINGNDKTVEEIDGPGQVMEVCMLWCGVLGK